MIQTSSSSKSLRTIDYRAKILALEHGSINPGHESGERLLRCYIDGEKQSSGVEIRTRDPLEVDRSQLEPDLNKDYPQSPPSVSSDCLK